jgi:hypothetical protein
MSVRIEITGDAERGSGIYGADGVQIPVGTEMTLKEEPTAWAGRYRVVGNTKGKTAATGLKAEHHGGGKFNITEGETVLLGDLTKADADAFNALSDEDKAAFVADQKKA